MLYAKAYAFNFYQFLKLYAKNMPRFRSLFLGFFQLLESKSLIFLQKNSDFGQDILNDSETHHLSS